MADNNALDPELAALLENATDPQEKDSLDLDSILGIEQEEKSDGVEAAEAGSQAKAFPEITEPFADTPIKAFAEPLAYYKEAISNTGEGGTRLHGILHKYIAAKDPKDRAVFRQQAIPSFWEMLRVLVRQASGTASDPKKFLLRYGMLHPQLIDAEQRALFSKIIVENEYDQPVYYLDEWFKAVGGGAIRNSSADEVKIAGAATNDQQKQLLERAAGKLDGVKDMIRNKAHARLNTEGKLKEAVEMILRREPSGKAPDALECYSQVQRESFTELQETVKELLKIDRETASLYRELSLVEDETKTLKTKIVDEEEAVPVDLKVVDTEFETVRQMTKMTVGRQGNHFPILTKEYFRCGTKDAGTRENIITQLAWIESIDPEAFCRVYRNKLNRIVPYVVLLPNYGDMGICWEPFDRYNRASSRARLAVPMYPKNLQAALLSAVADLRWQVAKEKASYYWMEEGLTGCYYQWFTERKLKGDVKETFIEDYIIWITKESEGTQRLDKELRGIFWRYVPFAQPIKEKLKNRSFAYQELYQRDVNRSLSDGY
ncbi:MAG: hypothetical protein LBB61_10050 [Treponema sp.]|jgi:hypothetical protein|nr:hypothetical protein [Treponema sp.]